MLVRIKTGCVPHGQYLSGLPTQSRYNATQYRAALHPLPFSGVRNLDLYLQALLLLVRTLETMFA